MQQHEDVHIHEQESLHIHEQMLPHSHECHLCEKPKDTSLLQLDSEELAEVFIEEHEGMLVASASFVVDGEFSLVEAMMEQALKHIAVDVTAPGGMIGHIKASVRSGGTTSSLSTMGEDIAIVRGSIKLNQVDIAVIVSNIEKKELETIIRRALISRLLNR